MKKTRFTEEQIIGVLKEAESGMKVQDLCRKHGISDVTFYNWRSKYGGLEVSEARRLKALEEENRRLKHIVAEQALDIRALKDVVSKSGDARCPMFYERLRGEGWRVKHKRVERLYRIEGLSLRRRRRKKRVSHLRVVREAPRGVNERWSMDFVTDSLLSGRRFRALTIVDEFSRECPAIEADFSLTGLRVARVLDRLAATRGLPEVIQVDNGPEFAGRTLDAWAYAHGVRLQFIEPGKPVLHAYIESFNGRLREECLNGQVFISLEDAREKIEIWRVDYNRDRPHGSLGHMTPEEFARQHQVMKPSESPNLSVVREKG